jgi:CRP-like cAMP-binding protein
MEEEIFKFLSRFVQLTDEEKDIIAENSLFEFYPAGHQLLREGQLARHCYFVLKGLLRSYYIQDGEEKVTDFFSERAPINPVSYITGQPSTYYISCIEDSIISISDKNRNEEFFARLPRMKEIGIQVMTAINAQQQLSYDDFRNLAPEKRYEKLLEKRPDLVNRVPQYMIASYLGIQPQSLSRIRKRLRDHKI